MIPDGPTKAAKPVANVAGQTKILGTSDNKKTVAEQILHKLAIMETRPQGRPQTGAGKSKKAERATITQDRKADTGDSEDVTITHDGTKQTHLESTHPSTKERHTTELKPVTVNTSTEDDTIQETTIDDTAPTPAL